MRRILIILVILMSLNSVGYAQSQCDEFNSPDKTRIYFVNGMDSDEVDNNNASAALAAVVGNQPDNVYLNSVNLAISFVNDGFQAWKQRADEVDPVKFWQQWHGTNPNHPQTSPEFKQAFADAIVAAANVQVSTDADLATMVAEYLIDLEAGKKVVLVAHSQGNFYANRAYEHITANYPQFSTGLGIVSVATPSGMLAPNALLTQNAQDFVIYNIVASLYAVLNANVSFTGNDKRHHGFLTTYMLAANARNRIGGHVQSMASQLVPALNTNCDERVAKISTLTATNVSAKEATLRGDLSQGKNVDVWITLGTSPSSVVCNGAGQNGIGINTAPSIVSQTATGLSPNSSYFYRACSKGQQGEVSDGGLKQFITDKNSGKINTPFEEDKTRFSITVRAEVLEGINIDTWFVRGQANDVRNIPVCNGRSFDGIGPLSAGDTAFGRFMNLEPGSDYRIMACAKGSDGITNRSFGFNTITTSSVPVTACGAGAFKGGTTGLSVIFNLGSQNGQAKIKFETFNIPDALEIFKHGTNQLLLSTPGFVSGVNTGSFNASGIDKVDVYVRANSDIDTRWELTIECPN